MTSGREFALPSLRALGESARRRFETRRLTIEIPEDVLLATGQSREEFVPEARFLLALKLFELGRLSSGKTAQLCETGRVDFIPTAGRMGIPVADLDQEEMKREFEHV
ncbi:MAG: UPF0175 family protein [Acidobacteriota bacterium]